MIHEPDFCPLEFTREQIDRHAAFIRFYEPLAHAQGLDSLASRQLHRHRGLVEYLQGQYHTHAPKEA